MNRSSINKRRRARDGYTLIELLLAMALFASLSTGLIALLARSSDFLASGASQTETMDSIQTFAEAFGADVRTLESRPDTETGRPDVRLYCDWAGCKLAPDRTRPDLTIQRLFFVRAIPGDFGTPAGRRAGVDVKADKFLEQSVDDAKNAAAGKLRASGGLMEVFWTAMPESPDDLAVMQIWRGFRAPIGDPPGPASAGVSTSLLPKKAWRDPTANAAERGPLDAAEIRARARPVLSGVLYFGVDFWASHTTTWAPTTRAADGGPLVTWDSTRGIMVQGDQDADSFFLSKRRGYQESASLDDPTDDVFPRKIRATCVVEELGRNARVGYLQDALAPDAKSMSVADTKFFPAIETSHRYLKVDAEWMEVGVPDGNTFPVIRRGARGTVAVKHDAGARVHHGRTFVQEYDVATFRDAIGDELGTRTGRGNYK
jgi:prepilin-type N-terminal cleavage/methylation domain-containing protein